MKHILFIKPPSEPKIAQPHQKGSEIERLDKSADYKKNQKKQTFKSIFFLIFTQKIRQYREFSSDDLV